MRSQRGAKPLGPASKNCLLNFGNRFGDLNSSWTSFGAVEGSAATPDTFFIIQDIKS
jgi:hypothetical protein